MLHWLLILLVFLVLRLGTFLTINGTGYPDILLPKHYLNYLIPELFRGFAGGHHWVLGALLPLAILSCYGLLTLVGSKTATKRSAVALALTVIMALEYHYGPVSGQTVADARIAFLDWLEMEEVGTVNLIHVPMNVDYSRRYYNFLQMLSGYPQVEGAINRVLPEAYTYINSNHLLRAWKSGNAAHCLPSNSEAFELALDQILEDGFTHVIMHDDMYFTRWEPHSFASVPASYTDDYVSIYRVGDLRRSCGNGAILGHDSLPHLRDLALSPEIRPDPDVIVLSVDPAQRIDDELFAYYASVFDGWADFVHLYERDGQVAVQTLNKRYTDINSVLSRNQLVLRIHDPRQGESEASKVLDERLASDYRTCLYVIKTPDTVAEYFVQTESPCELLASNESARVRYSNGIELENVMLDLQNSRLDLHLFWRQQPRRDSTHAFSIQVFDTAGHKVLQEDFVIGHKALVFHQLDVSALSAGTHIVQLILYNYKTGVSVSGIDLGNQSGFDRELELMRFTIE